MIILISRNGNIHFNNCCYIFILKDLNLKENISLSLEIQGIKTKIAKRKINKKEN